MLVAGRTHDRSADFKVRSDAALSRLREELGEDWEVVDRVRVPGLE